MACEPALDTATDAPALTAMTRTRLRDAARGPLRPGAAPLTGRATFATFSFWANVGETFHIDVAGPTTFAVYRTVDYPDFTPGVAWLRDRDRAFPLATPSGALDLVVEHTGYHHVAVGSPDAVAEVDYAVSSTVTRRHETTGVKSVASASYRGCAVLAGGTLKCWGFAWKGEALSAPEQHPGATMASMGDATPTVALPANAEAVSMAAPGGSAQVAALLEDGTVAVWRDDAAPARLPLAGPAKRVVRGSCAVLADERVQCWEARWDATTNAYAFVTSPPWSWPGRQVLSLTASDAVACVLLDGDNFACAPLHSPTTPAPSSVALAAGEHVRMAFVGGYDYGIVTDAAVHSNDFFVNSARTWTRRQTTLPAPAFVDVASPAAGLVSAVAPNGELWLGSHEAAKPGVFSWRPGPALGAPVQAISVHHSMANTHTCALVEGGRVKCFGSYNAGQLGLGDLVSREPSDPEVMGENLPALDLGN